MVIESVPPILAIAIVAGIISFVLAAYFAKLVLKEDPGNEKMVEVAGYIESGAKTFIKTQYMILGLFVIGLGILLLFAVEPGVISWAVSIAYWVGAVGSMWAGYMGMMVGVKANTRAAQA